jgi:HTH-type transcriptional regulator, sugar sensing transcriptional regulator
MQDILQDIGFEEKEATIYKTLLMLGSSSASKIAQEIGYDRTTTYYVLLRMLEKGFVSEIVEHNVKTFTAIKPSDILLLLEEKQQRFRDEIPKLENIFSDQKNPFKVEVWQGKEGLRHLYRDAISVGGEVLGLGVDDSQYMDIDDIGLKIYYRDAEASGMNERFLTHEKAKTFGSPIAKYKYIDSKYFQPTPIFIYGNKIVMVNWKPTLRLIYIESNEISDAFKKHFEALWAIGKKK